MTDAPRALPHHPFLQFCVGATYLFRALSFMQRHRLWKAAALPILINFLLLLGAALTGWYSVWPWLQSLQHSLSIMAGDGEVIAAMLNVLAWVAWLVLLPVMFVFAAVLVVLAGQVVASPFLDYLSERVEILRLGTAATPFGWRRLITSVMMALSDTLWGCLYLTVIYIPLILLSLVPVLGGVVSLACGGMLLAQEFVGLSMARHLVSYRGRWALVLQNRWFCWGFGVVAALCLAIPGLNIILLPTAAVGGTLLFCDLSAAGRLPKSLNLPRGDSGASALGSHGSAGF